MNTTTVILFQKKEKIEELKNYLTETEERTTPSMTTLINSTAELNSTTSELMNITGRLLSIQYSI